MFEFVSVLYQLLFSQKPKILYKSIIFVSMDVKKNTEAILTGWENFFFTKKEIEVIYKDRMKICKPCKKKLTIFCSQCGCPLATLLRQNIEKCKLGKWK